MEGGKGKQGGREGGREGEREERRGEEGKNGSHLIYIGWSVVAFGINTHCI